MKTQARRHVLVKVLVFVRSLNRAPCRKPSPPRHLSEAKLQTIRRAA
jgi:hypothetical protein